MALEKIRVLLLRLHPERATTTVTAGTRTVGACHGRGQGLLFPLLFFAVLRERLYPLEWKMMDDVVMIMAWKRANDLFFSDRLY